VAVAGNRSHQRGADRGKSETEIRELVKVLHAKRIELAMA
jgi:hypothetical protein